MLYIFILTDSPTFFAVFLRIGIKNERKENEKEMLAGSRRERGEGVKKT